jgi:hypothetical protein
MPRTVIFFIRHFWCGQCQDFMFASLSQLDPVAVEKAGIKVVVISNGSWKIIKSYKKLFKCPFPIYVDGPRKLYSLLGQVTFVSHTSRKLICQNDEVIKRFRTIQRPGNIQSTLCPETSYQGRKGQLQIVSSKPQRLMKQNAITKLPFAYPGKLTQLGGEFILSPGYNCDFAHRMTNTSSVSLTPNIENRS